MNNEAIANEPVTNLLRPNQTKEMHDEVSRLESVLKAPAFIGSQIQDRSVMGRQLRNLHKQLEEQTRGNNVA